MFCCTFVASCVLRKRKSPRNKAFWDFIICYGGEGGQYSFMLCNTAQLSKSAFVIGLSGDYDVFAIC